MSMTEFLQAAATFGSVELTVIVSVVLSGVLVLMKRVREVIWLNITIYGGVATNFMLKLIVGRERPGEERMIEAFGFSFEMESYSFPSGHTMRATILALVVGYVLFRFVLKTGAMRLVAGAALLFVVASVATSRVYFDYHFVSDAIVAVLAAVVFFAAMLWTKRFAENRVKMA
ncbi:phosphatase PAP2 family protein [Paenalkalicoccus suaedae]|uniref:Phosphatase PAP2 family protein n=1 Tax=Paenalkalicoccus suaedae TaxID=2592382 RepID=A0A859FA10_9BACI|nr:phosphatase PAP2 family protein [Paenalkalicoccus suaedae]QKS70009.1 phosphatase PAP2 family protein [Paenalkalicoccus suaedae]